MKIFTKISLISALIAAGLGILGIMIGLMMGAEVRDLNNMGIYLSPYQQIKITSVISEDAEETVEDILEESFYIYEEDDREHHDREHGKIF